MFEDLSQLSIEQKGAAWNAVAARGGLRRWLVGVFIGIYG